MTQTESADQQSVVYKVVTNHEEQYSIWPMDQPTPLRWRDEGMQGTREACLAPIKVIWTDLRPASLRRQMTEAPPESSPL